MPTLSEAQRAVLRAVVNQDAERDTLDRMTREVRDQIRMGERLDGIERVSLHAGAWVLLDGKIKAVVRIVSGGIVTLDVCGAAFRIPLSLIQGHVKILGGPNA